MISLDSNQQTSSESDVDIESVANVDIDHHGTVFDEPSYSPKTNNNNTGLNKKKHRKCYCCGLCTICLCLCLIGVFGAILIYLAVQSQQQVSPIHPPSTTIDIQLQIATNSSIGQLIQHQSQISSMIEQSANQISQDMVMSVVNIEFTPTDSNHSIPSDSRRLLQISNIIIANISMHVVVPSADPLDASQFNDFNWTNIILSELQNEEGIFTTSLQQQLVNTNLNIDGITVQQVTEQYVVMISANFGFDNFVEEGIFVALLSSQKLWALSQLSIESDNYETIPSDCWYLKGRSCGSRGGVTYLISNQNSSQSLQDILCSVHYKIIHNLGQAVETLNEEIRESSVTIDQPTDIRVCAMFDGIIDACAAQQINSRYICVNRDNSDDVYGFNCS